MAYKKIEWKVQDGIGRLVLNRPDVLNALDWEILGEVDQCLAEAEKDPEVRVIILQGSGRCFSAGYELGGIEGLTGPRGVADYGRGIWNSRAHVQGHLQYFQRIWNLWKPVIGQAHGFAVAGGCELLMHCDIICCAEGTRIGYPVTRWMASGDVIPVLAWRFGLAKSREMSMGLLISAEEAYRLGGINYVFPRDQLDQETEKIARRLATINPELLMLDKMQSNRVFEVMGFTPSLYAGSEFDSISHMSNTSRAYQEAVKQCGLAEALKKLNEPWGGV